MLRTRVMPCLLLERGRLVKTVRFKDPAYIGDPANAIKIYNEKEVDELIVVDISASVQGREPEYEVLSELTDECFMPLCYGGGIRTFEQAKRLFSLGIEKIAINTYAAERPEFLSEIAQVYGSQAVVLSMDVKRSWLGKYSVRTRSGGQSVSNDPVEYAKKMEGYGAGEILLNSIDRDGTWQGYDLELIEAITSAVGIPVIAIGGAGNLSHFAPAVEQAGASALALGSMAVYQGQDRGVLINFPLRTEIERVLQR